MFRACIDVVPDFPEIVGQERRPYLQHIYLHLSTLSRKFIFLAIKKVKIAIIIPGDCPVGLGVCVPDY